MMRRVERFTDFVQAHVEKTDPHRTFIEKETTREVATAAGADLPALYQLCKQPAEIDFSRLPDAFVVKPTHLSSNKGVFILFRVRDKFLDLLTKAILTEQEIVARLTSIIGAAKSNVIVEELIEGENGSVQIPYDYKLYTFDAGVRLIAQINRNVTPPQICLMDADFRLMPASLVRVNTANATQGTPFVPTNADEMIATARKVQQTLDRPFISIDTFTTGRRVVIGELTPTPGGPFVGGLFFFSPELDHKLGLCQIEGYNRRNWPLPQVEQVPPSRKHDRLFSDPS